MGGASLVAAAAPPPPGILAIRNLKPLGVRRLFSFSCSNSYPPNCSGTSSSPSPSLSVIGNTVLVFSANEYLVPSFVTLQQGKQRNLRNLITLVHCSINNVSTEIINNVSTESPPESEVSRTGAAYDFKGATTSLTNELLSSAKKVTLVRHGLSSWNEESRVQSTAELIWHGREQPLIFLDSLKEAHLFFLEGMTNADAKKKYPELYTKWREDPANFHVEGVYPIRRLWGTAREAWKEILFSPGESFLVVTHKSILRALICTALGLGPERFRSIDVNNGGISTFTINKRGEAMLQSLNMTAHMSYKEVLLRGPGSQPSNSPSRTQHSFFSRSAKSNTSRRRGGKCFRCLASDHWIADCRDPVKCVRCRRSGHRASTCKEKVSLARERMNRVLQRRERTPGVYVPYAEEFLRRREQRRNAVLADVIQPANLGPDPTRTIANALARRFGGYTQDFAVARFRERDFAILLPKWVSAEGPYRDAQPHQMGFRAWIKLINLPFECWTVARVAAIVCGFGRFVKANEATKPMTDLRAF
uniref:CCHC-type domain-containing protein n=1 Tax=Ananas comosus var. bracteatus TaxID=296719 RepID=A0A6V7QJU6_ANACO|nr:unnamed protein product [Ananas comosus var. bracteatus]